MKISEVVKILNAEVLCGEDQMDCEVQTACASDMMSDVLAFCKEQSLLLTGLTNPQVLRTADMLDIHFVIFVRGKQPSADMIQMAKEYGVTILATEFAMFEASGRLYQNGLAGKRKGW